VAVAVGDEGMTGAGDAVGEKKTVGVWVAVADGEADFAGSGVADGEDGVGEIEATTRVEAGGEATDISHDEEVTAQAPLPKKSNSQPIKRQLILIKTMPGSTLAFPPR
jgi:hypothetical protein